MHHYIRKKQAKRLAKFGKKKTKNRSKGDYPICAVNLLPNFKIQGYQRKESENFALPCYASEGHRDFAR